MENGFNKKNISTVVKESLDISLARMVLDQCQSIGIDEVCLCPGGRNSVFVDLLDKSTMWQVYSWFEERSAAFFAIGRARALERPVAVLTTSGTAAGELLPATMEAYYSHTPILLITADRPRRFRGSGAPQSAEQPHLFGCYTPYFQDLAHSEIPQLDTWDHRHPAHLNICLEEPSTIQATQ